MKIGILTIHFGRNYGSVLQAHALNKYLTESNYEVNTINYIPKRFGFIEKYKAASDRGIIICLIASLIRFPKNYLQYSVFQKFLKKNISMTRKITDCSQLEKVSHEYETIIVGSDQVWNYKYNKNCQEEYYLAFCSEDTKKISYAASFGVSDLPDGKKTVMKKHLSKFDNLSVREKQGVEILKSVGLKSEQCIDPVFLLEADYWKSIASNKYCSGEYIFVYALGGTEYKLINFADRLAKKLNLKIFYCGFAKLHDSRISKQYLYASPEDFLGLLMNSKFVVTNSFHATAFSIIFEKKFATIKRENFNSRIENILKTIGLSNRMVNYESDDESILELIKDIEYDKIKEKLKEDIDFSKDYLKLALEKKK